MPAQAGVDGQPGPVVVAVAFGARAGAHDDLVLALALAVWRANKRRPRMVHPDVLRRSAQIRTRPSLGCGYDFGGGYDAAGIHSILPDPRGEDRVFVAISCGGVWETHDSGANWSVLGKGLVALGRVVLSKRERVIMLQPRGKGLLGATLRYPYEVRDAKDCFSELPCGR